MGVGSLLPLWLVMKSSVTAPAIANTVAPRPLGVRLNNPLNVRPGAPWEGLGEPSEISGFCNFKNPVWGFRAAFKNLVTYADGHGINSIAGIIQRWAPPADGNDTDAYIAAVCKRTGYEATQVLALKEWNVAASVIRAMTIQEQGDFASYFTQAQMAEGAFRAGIEDAPPPIAKRVVGIVAGAGSAVGSVGTTAIAVAQPAVTASGNLKLIIGFAVISGVLAIIAGFVKAKPKAQG
jgi:hypothetical protein